MQKSLCLITGLVLVAACDEPGGRAGGNALVTTADGGDLADTSEDAVPGDGGEIAAEVGETPDTSAPETVVPVETTVADTDNDEASGGCTGCLAVSLAGAPTDVVFQQFPTTAWPTLIGGEAPLETWVLDEVYFFTNGTFATGIDVTFANNGLTAGKVVLTEDAMTMVLDLDLEVTVSAFGSTGSDGARSVLSLGGCHRVSGAQLVGTFSDCAGGLGAGDGEMDFELIGDSELQIGVEIARDDLIALLPPEQREGAGLAIVGPMYLMSSFVRPAP